MNAAATIGSQKTVRHDAQTKSVDHHTGAQNGVSPSGRRVNYYLEGANEMGLPKQLKIRDKNSDREGLVDTEKYIKAKTRDLRTFGYSNLSEDETRKQIAAILAGEKLNVIGMFIEGDIVIETT